METQYKTVKILTLKKQIGKRFMKHLQIKLQYINVTTNKDFFSFEGPVYN